MKGIAIRAATVEDALPIAKIHVETWQSAYPGLVPDKYLAGLSVADEAIARARQLSHSTGVAGTQVAVRNGAVLGFINTGPRRRSSLPYEGEIYELYVDIDFQDRGIGRRLMAAAFERFWDSGFGSAMVWVLAGNPSRFFYETIGGTVAGRREESFAGAVLQEIGYGWKDLAAWLADEAARGGPLDSPRRRH